MHKFNLWFLGRRRLWHRPYIFFLFVSSFSHMEINGCDRNGWLHLQIIHPWWFFSHDDIFVVIWWLLQFFILISWLKLTFVFFRCQPLLLSFLVIIYQVSFRCFIGLIISNFNIIFGECLLVFSSFMPILIFIINFGLLDLVIIMNI